MEKVSFAAMECVQAMKKEEIYITGIAGHFPDSNSVKELQDNLFKKKDLITPDDFCSNTAYYNNPKRSGKIKEIKKFDASFFGFNYKNAHCMDPKNRLLLERVYECLIDSGINPSDLRNTNTGVFVGNCITENERIWTCEKLEVNDYGIIGCSRAMAANCVSRWLGLKGPSYSVDTACSSSLYALENAFKSIKNGLCDAAIVGGVNLLLHPTSTFAFDKLGVLSPDGNCKSFDSRANGYVRSESIVACFLQKAKDSKRVYAKLVHAKTNCDGYKAEGITYPSGQVQKQLLEEFYKECNVLHSSVEFLEAHGTGTIVGDPEELAAIDAVFCKDRKEPLLIGSVKSNLGHSEASSGLNSIAKACIAYNTGYIPPNINFIKLREDIPALVEGRLRVVHEPQPWNRGPFALSSFGFGGANAHILLENVAEEKENYSHPVDGIPRLVCVSGRTASAVAKILDDLESRPVNVDEVRLWHSIHEKNILGHNHRGFVLLDSTDVKSVRLARNVQYIPKAEEQRLVLFKYTELQEHWSTVAQQLRTFPVFDAAFKRCLSALKDKNMDLIQLLEDGVQDNNFAIVGAVAVFIGLTDVLKIIGINPDYIIGNDIGELCVAYADDCLTAEQAIIAAYNFSRKITLKEIHPTSMNYKRRLIQTEEQVEKVAAADNTIVVEIGLHQHDLQLLKKDVSFVPLCKENTDNVQHILTSLGKLYELGLNPLLANIYPEVPFPVAQGTPMLSHLVEWDHTDDWSVTFSDIAQKSLYGQRKVRVNVNEDRYKYILGHSIDGRVIFPGTGYIVLVWETFALIKGRYYTELSVKFQDVYLKRATYIPKDGVINFVITIDKSGKFEITENNVPVVCGHICEREDIKQNYIVGEENFTAVSSTAMMNSKDFYKETNIRGYEYKGLFRGVQSCSVDCTRGSLAWNNNWVTFLDTILQTNIVLKDTRLLYLPTWIKSISIDVHKQYKLLSELNKGNALEFKTFPCIRMTRAGGVEMRGLNVVSISKKPPKGIPVFEKSFFIPNYSIEEMPMENIIRCVLQLIYENLLNYKFKNVELVDEEYKSNGLQPISEMVGDVLADLPLVQAELVILCEDPLDTPPTITVADKKISALSNNIIFIGANLLKRQEVLREATSTLKKGCFILSRENTIPDTTNYSSQYDVLTIHFTGFEYIVLIREKVKEEKTNYIKIETKDRTFSWIDSVKMLLKEGKKLVLYSQDEPVNGLLGLVNCLRREPGGEAVCGLLIADPTAPPFNPDCKLYKEHLDKGLGVNVFKNGQWGTYRHLLLEELEKIPAAHAYVNVKTIGDLNSLLWWEGRHSEKSIPLTEKYGLVQVYYSALNFRDVMTSLGRVTVDAVAEGRLAQDCVMGLEFAGRTANGTRVMGIGASGAISNMVETGLDCMWPVLDEWSFEEAVTIPVAYITVYQSLVIQGRVSPGESILIHAGSGGVGQAAIRVALHYGLDVFTTVGTPAKRAFIKRLFPELKDNHIGNSRDTSFEKMIWRETNGRGVDLVLNSLSDDKLQASVKCLRANGRFLEIGKYDITANTELQMCFLKNEISFHSVMLDFVIRDEISTTLCRLLLDGIQSGAVRPLTYCTFDKYDIVPACRYMAAGKHIGKIVIKIREEEPLGSIVKPTSVLINAVPRYMCDENQVYVLVGGLGGFGLELADWLILRGARKIVMSSRRGISNGYQSLRIRIWKSYGAEIQIATHDVTTEAGCEDMLKMAAALGPVKAIFNLAVVLDDAIFQNQTPETFAASFGPKALATMHLDKLSRTLCPDLKDFVIFSSVSCGRGNAGQTNYGFSNSVMERICEERKKEGLPAIAIQWGAIGDVGLVADMQEENVQLEIGGTLQQRISSCFQAMDQLLKQDAAVVSSIVVAEKRASNLSDKSVVEVIAQILGISNLKTASHQAALSEMGMDSVMAVEIKQTLERDYEIFLTAQEIRLLTFAKLSTLAAKDSPSVEPKPDQKAVETSKAAAAAGLNMMINNFGDEKLATEPFIYLNSKLSKSIESTENKDKIIFLLPGLVSCASTFEYLCSNLHAKTCVLQFGLDVKEDSLEQMVDKLYKTIANLLPPRKPFILLGYSFGTVPVMNLAAKLESEGRRGIVICLDGSPQYVKLLNQKFLFFENDNQLQNHIICHSFNTVYSNYDAYGKLTEKLEQIHSYKDKVKCAIDMIPVKLDYSDEFMYSISKVTYDRIKMLLNLNTSKIQQIQSPIILIRPKNMPINVDMNENYDLDKLTKSNVTVHYLDANHTNILEKEECAEIVNKSLNKFIIESKKAARRSSSAN